jgi:hypothetical protein
MRVPFWNARSPPCRLVSADQSAEQRRLAGAVRPGKRDAVAALDLERDAVEERVAAQLLAQVGGNQHGHGL